MASLIVLRVMLRHVHTFVNLSRIASGTWLFSNSIYSSLTHTSHYILNYIETLRYSLV